MRKSAVSLAAILILGLLLGGITLATGVRAQSYPPPVGSLSVKAGSTTPGSTTNVTATVLDNNGDPVEGAQVTFTIISQPGTDAAWTGGGLETTATTDANGVAIAVLKAGSDPGNIVVETVSGEKTSQVTVAVQSSLPSTGGAPAVEGTGSGIPTWQIAFLAVGAATLAGGLVIMVRRNKRA
jgi:hypothetical protein